MPRCRNCSALLPEASPVCAYCGTVNDVDLRRVGGYTEAEPETKRHCPDCDMPMASWNISAQPEKRFLVDRCERCLGMFFDTGELEAILEASVFHADRIDFARLGEMGTSAPPDILKYRKCPVCGKYMNRVNFGARSGVITDQCGKHGTFLQAGELNRLLDWRKSGGNLLDDQLKKEKENAERKFEEERQKWLAKWKREAGDYGHSFF